MNLISKRDKIMFMLGMFSMKQPDYIFKDKTWDEVKSEMQRKINSMFNLEKDQIIECIGDLNNDLFVEEFITKYMEIYNKYIEVGKPLPVTKKGSVVIDTKDQETTKQ